MHIKNMKVEKLWTLNHVEAKLGKYNVIYGQNASGKTLLSGVFRAGELGQALDEGEVTLELKDDPPIRKDGIAGGMLKDTVRVFNSHFVDENVFVEDPRAIVLGSQDKEVVQRMDDLKEGIAQLHRDRGAHTKQGQQATSKLEQDQSNVARDIKETLARLHHYPGANRSWLTYDRANARARMNQIADDPKHYIRSNERLEVIKETIADSAPQASLDLELPVPPIRDWASGVREILHRSVRVGELPDADGDMDRLEWIRHGQEFVRDDAGCGYCLQPVPSARSRAITIRFSSEDERLRVDALNLEQDINRWKDENGMVVPPDPSIILEEFREEYTDLRSQLEGMRGETIRWLDDLKSALKSKLADPQSTFAIEDPLILWNVSIVDELNRIIAESNVTKSIVDDAWEYEYAMIAERCEEWHRREADAKMATESLKSNADAIKSATDELEELRRESDGAAMGAHELTEMLGAFIGHREFRIELNPDNRTYSTYRGDTIARGFSEGERTAIGITYFLKSLEDENFDSMQGIVVIDDPVTSFDDDRLFDSVSQILIRTGARGESATTPVGQLILLTHHLGLLERLWRELGGKNAKANFYSLKCKTIDGDRRASLRKVKHPTRFPYHVAFDDVALIVSGDKSVNNPWNSMRKCLEGFLMSIVPTEAENGLEPALTMLNTAGGTKILSEEDNHTMINLLSAGSHTRFIHDPIDSEADWERAERTASVLFGFMKAADPAHFKDMEHGNELRQRQG